MLYDHSLWQSSCSTRVNVKEIVGSVDVVRDGFWLRVSVGLVPDGRVEVDAAVEAALLGRGHTRARSAVEEQELSLLRCTLLKLFLNLRNG